MKQVLFLSLKTMKAQDRYGIIVSSYCMKLLLGSITLKQPLQLRTKVFSSDMPSLSYRLSQFIHFTDYPYFVLDCLSLIICYTLIAVN